MSKFKVGDRVRVVETGYEFEVWRVEHGCVGERRPCGGVWWRPDFELELVTPSPDRLTALESRVSALEAAFSVGSKAIMNSEYEKAAARADREAEAFVRALPPEQGVPDCNCGAQDRPDHSPHKDCCRVYANEARPKPASELRRGEVIWRTASSPWRTASAWGEQNPDEVCYFRRTDTGAEITKAEFVRALENSERDERGLGLGDVEYRIGDSDWDPVDDAPAYWLDGWEYTARGWQFRNRHTKAAISEAEFLDICRRERDGGKAVEQPEPSRPTDAEVAKALGACFGGEWKRLSGYDWCRPGQVVPAGQRGMYHDPREDTDTALEMLAKWDGKVTQHVKGRWDVYGFGGKNTTLPSHGPAFRDGVIRLWAGVGK